VVLLAQDSRNMLVEKLKLCPGFTLARFWHYR